MHIGNTEIFYFIIEQPTPEPEIVLGVTFNSMLSFAPHVQNVASKAAASLYALRMLKAMAWKARHYVR